MAGRSSRRSRRLGPCVLAVALAISGCGGSGDPSPPSSSTTTMSPWPTTSDLPATSEEPAPTTSSSEIPEVPNAEAVCASVYADRGVAPHADSEDMDDEMALFETWHVGLLEDAISQLGSEPELRDLVAALDEMRSLSARAALIYAEHPVFSQELSTIQERQDALAEEVGPIAREAGAPSCAALVVLP